jgi:hypothetical protein
MAPLAYDKRPSKILFTLVVSVQYTDPPGFDMMFFTRTSLNRCQ